jgi:hypothetical protein
MLKGSFIVAGDLLFASLMAIIGSYGLAYHALRIRGLGFERFFVSLAASVSGIWLYEIVYHYIWAVGAGISMTVLWKDLVYASTNTDGVRFPLLWSLMMLALPFVVYREMRVNRYFLAILVISGLFFIIWSGLGFPQFFSTLPPPGFNRLRFTENANLWTVAGYIFNSTTKVLNLAPALLFYGEKKSESAQQSTGVSQASGASPNCARTDMSLD